MIWTIICYNGTIWEAKWIMNLSGTIEMFKKETGLSEMDIKRIENLH